MVKKFLVEKGPTGDPDADLLTLVGEMCWRDQAGPWDEFLCPTKWSGAKCKSISNMYINRRTNHLIGQELTK